MFKLVSTDSDSAWDVMDVILIQNNVEVVQMYISCDRADAEARKLSKLFPEHTVQLATAARIKAVYQNGERLVVNDYRQQFYTNLTDAQYRATQIFCSETHKWI